MLCFVTLYLETLNGKNFEISKIEKNISLVVHTDFQRRSGPGYKVPPVRPGNACERIREKPSFREIMMNSYIKFYV